MTMKKALTEKDLSDLPLVTGTKQFADLIGLPARSVQYACKHGSIPAKLVSGRYFINTKEALKVYGIEV